MSELWTPPSRERDERVWRVMRATRLLEAFRHSVLDDAAELVPMIERGVAFVAANVARERLPHQREFGYLPEVLPDGGVYMPSVKWIDNGTEETYQLAARGGAHHYPHGGDIPVPAGDKGLGVMADRLEGLVDIAQRYPGACRVDPMSAARFPDAK